MARLDHYHFHSSVLPEPESRVVQVYLPPQDGWDAGRRFPVFYLQDGQNLFDEATSYQGIEWGVDEAAQKLIASGAMQPTIIVGIYNTDDRTSEFTPPIDGAKNAKGDLYVRMLVEEAKPFIDQRYRTQPDRAGTTIGGGSLGGLISLYAAKTHNDVFGGVIALSPWLREDDKSIVNDLVGDGAWLKNTRIYIDMGTDGGHNYPGGAANAITDLRAFVAAAEKTGAAPGKTFIEREVEGDQQNESSWHETITQVLSTFYPANLKD